jgi:4-hydroxy-3-methylbut-2-en-1-yl diphosphate reductase
VPDGRLDRDALAEGTERIMSGHRALLPPEQRRSMEPVPAERPASGPDVTGSPPFPSEPILLRISHRMHAMTTATRPDVRIAERAGFCYGVRLAIDKAKHAREEGKEVTTLGQLVHNPGIKADLSDRGIRTADLADQVEGGTLVIRAHGVPKSEFEQVKGKESLEVIDATCTWVLQSQKAARELAEAGYTVCIIGHEDHPEVKGVRSYAGEKHVVVDDMDRSTWERVPRTKKIGVLSQSTILPNKLEEFAAFCLRRCHDLRVVNTVCPVTLTRQDDSVKLAREVDAMIVVGGKNSSNTKELAVKCREIQPETDPRRRCRRARRRARRLAAPTARR